MESWGPLVGELPRARPGRLYWAYSHLHLPTLADAGYHGAGCGMHTPIKQPASGHRLRVDNHTYNTLLRSLRAEGERAFALLTRRWRALHHITVSPTRIGDIVKSALVLTHVEHKHSLLRSPQVFASP